MSLYLRASKIRTMADSENSWPSQNQIILEGLVYDAIDNNSPIDSQSRLKWIRLQNLKENFSPQPYEQLAKVLRMSGYEEGATKILIAKHNDARLYGKVKGFSWVLNYVLGSTIDHGYRPQKILIGILVFLILGWGIFSWGESHKLIYPSRIIALVDLDSEQKIIDPNYPKFNALIYSIDTFLPIIDFYQESYWLPNGNKGNNTKIPTVSLNFSTSNPLPKLNISQAKTGNLLRWYFWFHIVMGWVLTSLAVAGFTGLVRRLG